MRSRKTRFSRLGLLSVALLLSLLITGIGHAAWTDEVYIEGTVATGTWDVDVGGSKGFWKNWDSHNTYNKSEIEGWLAEIDGASRWLGPITVDELDQLFDAAEGPKPTMKSRFLAHYMATRLNIAAGRLTPANTHNITRVAGYGYLGLPNPTAATLSAIVTAIERKHPDRPEHPSACWPTRAQYEIMKDICDMLNSRGLEVTAAQSARVTASPSPRPPIESGTGISARADA